MSHTLSGNKLSVICKSNFELKVNIPAYTGMCLLELLKVLKDKLLYDYIKINQKLFKSKNKSELLFTDTNILMHQTKTTKKCLISKIIQLSQNTTTFK